MTLPLVEGLCELVRNTSVKLLTLQDFNEKQGFGFLFPVSAYSTTQCSIISLLGKVDSDLLHFLDCQRTKSNILCTFMQNSSKHQNVILTYCTTSSFSKDKIHLCIVPLNGQYVLFKDNCCYFILSQEHLYFLHYAEFNAAENNLQIQSVVNEYLISCL